MKIFPAAAAFCAVATATMGSTEAKNSGNNKKQLHRNTAAGGNWGGNGGSNGGGNTSEGSATTTTSTTTTTSPPVLTMFAHCETTLHDVPRPMNSTEIEYFDQIWKDKFNEAFLGSTYQYNVNSVQLDYQSFSDRRRAGEINKERALTYPVSNKAGSSNYGSCIGCCSMCSDPPFPPGGSLRRNRNLRASDDKQHTESRRLSQKFSDLFVNELAGSGYGAFEGITSVELTCDGGSTFALAYTTDDSISVEMVTTHDF